MHWVLWVLYYLFSVIKFDKFYDILLSPLHFTKTKTPKKPHNNTDSHHSSRQKHQKWKQGERSKYWWRVTLPVQTCSGCNLITPSMRWPKTDSAPNMPVTLSRKQLLIRCVITSPVHTVTVRCYGTRKHYKCVPNLDMSLLKRYFRSHVQAIVRISAE
jgi:hypothetical protein